MGLVVQAHADELAGVGDDGQRLGLRRIDGHGAGLQGLLQLAQRLCAQHGQQVRMAGEKVCRRLQEAVGQNLPVAGLSGMDEAGEFQRIFLRFGVWKTCHGKAAGKA